MNQSRRARSDDCIRNENRSRARRLPDAAPVGFDPRGARIVKMSAMDAPQKFASSFEYVTALTHANRTEHLLTDGRCASGDPSKDIPGTVSNRRMLLDLKRKGFLQHLTNQFRMLRE